MIRVRLLRQNRIDGRAGDIVEVSPARAEFLMGLGLAEPAEEREKKAAPEKAGKDGETRSGPRREQPEKGRKAENPENGNQTENPENGNQTENPEKAKSKRSTKGK